jgi:glutamyl-tRNA reductase
VLPSFFTNDKERLVLDLSIPQNVDPAIKNIPGIQLMNVDEISVILDKTIDKRKAEIPQALQVIAETISELKDWYESQAHNPVLRKIKSQLNELAGDEITMCNKQRIQKTVSFLAIQLKKESNKGCQYINALNNYFLPDYEATA